MGMVKRKLH